MSCMSMWAGNAPGELLSIKDCIPEHMPSLLQALLAAVAAGPGGKDKSGSKDEVPAAEADAAELTELWHGRCVIVVRTLGRTISGVAEAGGGASALQQLGQLGVWRLLEQLVEATGAPCCAWLLEQELGEPLMAALLRTSHQARSLLCA